LYPYGTSYLTNHPISTEIKNIKIPEDQQLEKVEDYTPSRLQKSSDGSYKEAPPSFGGHAHPSIEILSDPIKMQEFMKNMETQSKKNTYKVSYGLFVNPKKLKDYQYQSEESKNTKNLK
jgi:hypothetical protein